MIKNLFKKNEEKSKLETLSQMGFTLDQSKHALNVCDGNLERASNFLLENHSHDHSGSSTSSGNGYRSGNGALNVNTSRQGGDETEEQQLQRIMAESIAMEERRKEKAAVAAVGTMTSMTTTTRKPSAAAIRAGQAAVARAENANRRYGANGKLLAKRETKKKKSHISTTTTETSAVTIPMQSSPSASAKEANITSNSNKSKQALKSHPKVKIPTQMKDKSKEEQILRCTKRIARHTLAVDTLLRAFTFIRQNPDDDKYRRIDQSTMGFKNALEGKPGVMDLLFAMNFVRGGPGNSKYLILERARVDMALLYLGISALEEVRKSEEYTASKLSIQFEKELRMIQNGECVSEEDEVLKRAQFVSKLPTEPEGGAGALMQISLGSDKIMRRFDGDDILQDVINFIGGHGSAIPEKILSREWCLVDLNQYPLVPIDTERCINKTLQYIGCWPSGKLSLQPSSSQWRERKEMEKVGSSRGLGARTTSS